MFMKSQQKTAQCLWKLRSIFSRKGQVMVPIGSAVNGLGRGASDLDVVLITDQADDLRSSFNIKFRKNERFRRAQMGAVTKLLDTSGLARPGSVQQLLFCSVPIVKFCSRDGVSVDLQFNNIGTIRSSLFVRTCVEANSVVPIIIHWMNDFFDAVKLKDSRHGLFSSYNLNMLAIHFIQAAPFALLPNMINLHPQLHPSFSWMNAAELLAVKVSEANTNDSQYGEVSAAESIIKMIDYYSQQDLQTVAVDICGNTFERRTEDDNDGFIHIIDPYFADDPSPSSRCGVRNGASLLLEAFCALKSELQMGNLRRLTQIRLP